MASCVSTFFFYRRERPQDFRVVQHVIIPVIPLIVLVITFWYQVYPVPPFPLNLAVPILVIWVILGFVYMLYLGRRNPEALQQGKEIFLQDLETEPTGLADGLL